MKIIKLSVLVFALGMFSQSYAQEKSKEVKQKRHFNKIDKDSNGSISSDEMVAFYEGKENKKGKLMDGVKIFKRKDVNKDGMVTFEEFIAKPKKGNKKKKKN